MNADELRKTAELIIERDALKARVAELEAALGAVARQDLQKVPGGHQRLWVEYESIRAKAIEECAKVAESYEPHCDACPRGVANAIRALTKKPEAHCEHGLAGSCSTCERQAREFHR